MAKPAVIAILVVEVLIGLAFLFAGGACINEICIMEKWQAGIVLGVGVGIFGGFIFTVPIMFLLIMEVIPNLTS